ncbi:unnamed protein product [Cylicostephanus goldi]|uniref:Serine aminopeptidase S33 domain-containing protein n=1 Tax=Cylicostephanus goldi TaxID=71465 RepID=A0A3P6R681_CYLGO|nr:unnamed protein product [Cylicostephanus goldi]
MTDYSDVSANNVNSLGRAFYLRGDEGNVGVWYETIQFIAFRHMLPRSLSYKYREKGIHPQDEDIEESLSDEKHPIVVYLHGNSFDRTIGHRVELYNVLNKLEYHVVAFDYRGYGDSDGDPSEKGLVNDSLLVYEYVKQHCGNNTVIIWGHSMGTGVAVHLVKNLCVEGNPPEGLVLESPFNNLGDAIMGHVLGIPLRWMSDDLLPNSKVSAVSRFFFSHLDVIFSITCPILMLHAENDHVIPVTLARKLRDAAVASQRDIKYVEFETAKNYKHKFIYMAPELSTLIP